MVAAIRLTMNKRWRNDQPRLAAYQSSVRWNPASSAATMRLSWPGTSRERNSHAHIIGVRVSEITPDMMMAMLTVTANSRNSRPIRPLISSSGMKTAVRETVIDTIVKPISRDPTSAACSGRSPASMWRMMFSIITTASSMMKPTAMVSAISDTLSSV